MKTSRFEVLRNFGFRKKDPFIVGNVRIETNDMRRISEIMDMAIDSHAMIAIVGERGLGKTEVIESTMKAKNCRVVRITAADKEALKIGDIEVSLINGLSDEKIKRSRITRGFQVKKLLTQVSLRQEIVLLIEEAHRIHGQTLRSLKTLREPDGGGKPQFTVVFVGQFSFLDTGKGLDEVRLRADTVMLNGLSEAESVSYIQKTVGSVFQKDAIELLAKAPTARNFLDLQYSAIEAMEHAYFRGKQKVTKEDILAVCEIAEELKMPTVKGDDLLDDILGDGTNG